jgi:succinate dehydrogenase / fumarate reductase cytochrome b subunit
MAWLIRTFNSSIGKKLLMALTGLFLTTFLFVHLAGNLILLKGQAGALDFNAYAKFMTTFPLIKAISYLLYASILGHAVWGVMLAFANKSARPQNYAKVGNTPGVSWASKNMAVLGTIIFAFIVIHMKSFWFEMHFGQLGVDANGNKDLYTLVETSFKEWWYVALYVVSMAALGFHLYHGIQSGFQTLGLRHAKYTPLIKTVTLVVALLVPAAFAAIPVGMFFMFGR